MMRQKIIDQLLLGIKQLSKLFKFYVSFAAYFILYALVTLGNFCNLSILQHQSNLFISLVSQNNYFILGLKMSS